MKIGQKAPDFELKDINGKIRKLSDYKNKILVLYFYPKDMTPGCTKEACNLRDNCDKLRKKGVDILGVSLDDQNSLKNIYCLFRYYAMQMLKFLKNMEFIKRKSCMEKSFMKFKGLLS